ncbi:hypothetical protein KY343_01855 [Candidatus Woesearchaeota archaeon]|nr:hypothetical protein [Candidatus Woesearchaeota archaeon]
MLIKVIGDHPLARNEDGSLKNVKANAFPTENVIISGPGTHGDLLLDYMNKAYGKYDEDLEDRLIDTLVPLHMRKDTVLIRPEKIDLAFEADELLQEIISKEKIKFLGVLDPRVRDAIKKRGELWRINYLPKTVEEMKEMIKGAKGSIGCRPIYYHSMETGIRWLTFEEFEKLGELDNKELARHLQEINKYCCDINSCGNNEIRFFMAEDSFNLNEYKDDDFTGWDGKKIRFYYEALKSKFWCSVKSEFRKDELENEEWRKAMFSRLIGEHDEEISEEDLLGLGCEFYMHIQWLPGARIENGEVIFDSIFSKVMPEEEKIYDEKVRSIILNFRREHDDIEYINVGRVIGSLSKRETMPGRREVYIVSFKVEGEEKERKRMIRLQKFGAVERLQSGEEKDVYKAFWYADEYKRYTLDRWNACEQLGMKLLPITTDDIYETIDGVEVPLIYFERDYIDGIATDKIPASRFENKEYAARFAKLLGEAAVVSMVTGRADNNKVIHFDDGDEVIIEEEGLPVDLINAENTSSFGDYTTALSGFTEAYAMPVINRKELVSDIRKFARDYVKALVDRFTELQKEYRDYQGAFDSLFKDRIYDKKGSIAYRWEKVLERLNTTDPIRLGEKIMAEIDSHI